MKLVLAGVATLAIAGTAIGLYAVQASDPATVPDKVDVDVRSGRAAELVAIRRLCDPEALDAFIEAQRAVVDAAEGAAKAEASLVLATAYVERIALANSRAGLRIGEPIYDEVPPDIAGWIERGDAALDQAAALGLETSERHRLRAALFSARIVGLGSAFTYSSKVKDELARAEALDPGNPHVQVAQGLRALLAPKILGHDPARALEHFELAMEGLPEDERPRVFASMATWLQDDRARSRELIDEATRLTPANSYAQIVRRRMQDGDPQPFASDVSDAELGALGTPTGR